MTGTEESKETTEKEKDWRFRNLVRFRDNSWKIGEGREGEGKTGDKKDVTERSTTVNRGTGIYGKYMSTEGLYIEVTPEHGT